MESYSLKEENFAHGKGIPIFFIKITVLIHLKVKLIQENKNKNVYERTSNKYNNIQCINTNSKLAATAAITCWTSAF